MAVLHRMFKKDYYTNEAESADFFDKFLKRPFTHWQCKCYLSRPIFTY